MAGSRCAGAQPDFVQRVALRLEPFEPAVDLRKLLRLPRPGQDVANALPKAIETSRRCSSCFLHGALARQRPRPEIGERLGQSGRRQVVQCPRRRGDRSEIGNQQLRGELIDVVPVRRPSARRERPVNAATRRSSSSICVVAMRWASAPVQTASTPVATARTDERRARRRATTPAAAISSSGRIYRRSRPSVHLRRQLGVGSWELLESTHRMGMLHSLLGAVGLASAGQARTLTKRVDTADQRPPN